jgi:hypothetical protein
MLASCVERGAMTPRKQAARRPVVVLIASELRGTLEPCGCTSHPLGGLYRLGTVVARARREGAVLLVSGGDVLFESSDATRERSAQERAKAETLTQGFARMGLWAGAVGALDRVRGQAAKVPWRALDPRAPFGPNSFASTDAGGIRVGVAAVLAARPADARGAISSLRSQGARVVVLLVRGERDAVRALVRSAPGADFAIVTKSDGAHAAPERVGETTLLEVGSLGQHVGRLSLYLNDARAEPILDGEPSREAFAIARLRVEQARRALSLAQKNQAPAASIQFAQTLFARRVAAEASAERDLVRSRPTNRSYFVWRLTALDKSIPDDPELLALRHAYKQRLRTLNMADAAKHRAPAPAKDAATYRGNASCGTCHDEALAFWKRTGHGRAWATLVREQSDFDLSCVGCHMTGYLAAGGASLSQRPELRDVGCETCHGPGSLHEDAPDDDKKRLTHLDAPEEVCRGCHTPEHSDLFSYVAYRRRILGPGHGEPVAEKKRAPKAAARAAR